MLVRGSKKGKFWSKTRKNFNIFFVNRGGKGVHKNEEIYVKN